jgi:non-ribosomal peptide synthetase component E (peptide arylation enzyme)
MTGQGRVINGVVVPEPAARLPEGATVRIQVVPAAGGDDDDGSLAAELLKLSGSCTGLPSDLARNHDHYLYGAAKR